MFAVIYQGYIKPGRESDYKNAWNTIATYFIEKRGALGSCLHKTKGDLWVAYSRWPDQATRDASWPKEEGISSELPQEIHESIVVLKDCMEEQLPEIAMEVVNDLLMPDKISDNCKYDIQKVYYTEVNSKIGILALRKPRG